MTASNWLGGMLLLGALLGTGPAHAQPTAVQKETARELMAEGRELREKGDLEAALTRFGAADSLMGVPTTGFEVAATQAQLGRLVEARETLRRVLLIAQSPDDPEPFNEARSKARSLDQQLSARIAGLSFAIRGVPTDVALEVSVDGELVPKAVLSLPLRVNPGRHLVVARAAGRELKREVDTAEGQTSAVELAFAGDAPPAAAAADDSAAAPSAPSAPPAAAPAPTRNALPPLAYVGGGVGLAGVLVGSISGISAISHKNEAKKGCVAGSCPPSTWSDLDSAHSLATVSTVGFVIGAVGVVVGAGAILLDGDEPSGAQRGFVLSPDVTRQGARLTIAGSF
jgi:hypothetical protein